MNKRYCNLEMLFPWALDRENTSFVYESMEAGSAEYRHLYIYAYLFMPICFTFMPIYLFVPIL